MKPAAFLEAHIEQGNVLEQADKTVGVVTGMQGKRTFLVQVEGEENHAGTSPRSVRRDALVAAVNIVQALQSAMWDKEDVVRFTIGMFTVSPNAPSVVPASVSFSIDLRHPDGTTLGKLGDSVPDICRANRGPCEVSANELLHDPPLGFPATMRATIRSIAAALDEPCIDVPSLAWHDAKSQEGAAPTFRNFHDQWRTHTVHQTSPPLSPAPSRWRNHHIDSTPQRA
jgi:beta-ureidopropionase / N-carbamoyl-L-amino-acid hydrolase